MNNSLATKTKLLLKKYNIRLKKSMGQNLLIDKTALERIADAANLSNKDIVIEIGTGTGLLTKTLAERAGFVYSFETDTKILKAAKEYLQDHPNITLVNQNFLEFNIQNLKLPDISSQGIKIVANVPYYITTPIIEKIIDNKKI